MFAYNNAFSLKPIYEKSFFSNCVNHDPFTDSLSFTEEEEKVGEEEEDEEKTTWVKKNRSKGVGRERTEEREVEGEN